MTKYSPVQRLDTLRRDLARKHDLGATWRELARQYPGVPAGTLCAIAKGREPKSPAIRAALGLPSYAPAPVCPVHGVVHVAKACPKQRQPAYRSLFDWPVRELARAMRDRR